MFGTLAVAKVAAQTSRRGTFAYTGGLKDLRVNGQGINLLNNGTVLVTVGNWVEGRTSVFNSKNCTFLRYIAAKPWRTRPRGRSNSSPRLLPLSEGGAACHRAAIGDVLRATRNMTPVLNRKLFCRLLLPSGNFVRKYSAWTGRIAKCLDRVRSIPPPAVMPNAVTRSKGNSIFCPDASEKNPSVRSELATPQIDPRSEKIRNLVRGI